MLAGLGVSAHPINRQIGLRTLLNEPFSMSQHHGADRRGDQQRRGRLESEHVAVEDQGGDALHVAAVLGVGLGQPDRVADDRVADGEHQQGTEADARQRRQAAAGP